MKTSVIVLTLFLLLLNQIHAEVVRIEIKERKILAYLPDADKTGPYEVIKGIIYLEVDPDELTNEKIVDLKYAPRNRHGKVEFSTDFELHKPVDPSRGNHRLMYIVCNRGNRGNFFSSLRDRDWFYSEGWSYLYCGWQCDLEESDKLFNLRVPVITENGKAVTGKVLFEFFNYEDSLVYSMPLIDKGSPAYPVVSMNNLNAALTIRQYPWEKPVEIPRNSWQFARYEKGKVLTDSTSVYIKDGFRPGWLYDLVYEAKNPGVVGLGLATIRDVVSYLRYDNSSQNPLSGSIQYAFAFGHSQSGRLLNHFIYQNFNGDEKGRMVFDGVIANCPGAGKGEFNSRFAQPTRYSSHLEDNLYLTDYFPLLTIKQIDPLTREEGDAFKKARDSGFMPRLMIINSSTDYWTRGASLLHTDVEGKKDAEIDPSCRIYLLSGRAHTENRTGVIARALLVALDKWVSEGITPPDSRVPRIDDGTLVDLAALKMNFPNIPNIVLPASFYQPVRLDPGPRWKTLGIADHVPPREGDRYVTLVPQVDPDGNEIAGVRFPEVSVPLASFIGWSQRKLTFSNTLGRNAGKVWPFAVSKEDRIKNGDSRKSILERYPQKMDYLLKYENALSNLKDHRFLLAEDVSILYQEALDLDYWPVDKKTSIAIKTVTINQPVAERGVRVKMTVQFDGKTDDIASVKAVLREGPSNKFVFRDDGCDGDDQAGDNVWTYNLFVVMELPSGQYHFDIRVIDKNGNPCDLPGIITNGKAESWSKALTVK